MPYADPEKRREYDRQYYATHKEKKRESIRCWQQAHPEKKREYNRRWEKLHLEKRRERARRYRKDHPEKVLEYEYRYKDRLRAQVLDLLGGKCARCGFNDPRVLQVDHINGGGIAEHKALGYAGLLRKVLSDPTGYQLLCPTCNWLKRVERKEYRGRKKERMPSEDCVSGVPFRRQA